MSRDCDHCTSVTNEIAAALAVQLETAIEYCILNTHRIRQTMSQQQTVNVADLDIAQLTEVRKQLEDVIARQPFSLDSATDRDRH